MSFWRKIEICPEDGFFLCYENGAIRTLWRHKCKFENPAIPILITKEGNRLVPREVLALRGEVLELSDCVYEPTHWMPLPELPE